VIIVLIWYKPFADAKRNFYEIRDELTILTFLIFTRVYTPWVTDPDARYKL
jgi:hypothetical protein